MSELRPETRAALTNAGLDPERVVDIVQRALDEDLDGGVDVTTVATVDEHALTAGDLVTRSDGAIAGIPVAAAVFELAGGAVLEPVVRDGTVVAAGTAVATVAGPTRAVLTAERTALNLMGRLSGIATLTAIWVDAVRGTGAEIRDTRKTTPGLRILEKYAVRCGGGVNHRMSLSDAAMVKDNHVVAAGGVVAAFEAVRSRWPRLPIEVEADTVEDAVLAVEAGADLVLLDNMGVEDLRRAVALVAGRARLEASGGLTLRSARDVAETGVDYLAVGALTHSAQVLDIGLDLHGLPARGEKG
ncbi:nicotinate-nucleotide pyrophosphorylase (carboxylating) [Motilibacter peucedani]|uniref:Nicotinate-nucleotide pyrophosphorylase [carboxylating] n=1 Tax=Motilibacter peucedani TaxID=598650 RepID=A0A420XPT6_9ACTN|nr:carboxylating nicotinate-nucleotide diphosphorylase [Motilibacter peucedani]RKS75256.1 nicotinate-nucleotide pyrophosphorylase (carboxylating) [Motilibacter peucedani]